MDEEYGMPDTLLIVDDSELNRVILTEIFHTEYKIEEAENGKEGWDKLLHQRGRICAILLDVVMPEMDGIEFLNLMNEKKLIGAIPVFLITASVNEDVVKEAYQLGVMDVINKPVVPYMILRRVNSIVELFRARRQLKDKIQEQSWEILKQAKKIIELNKGMIEALATAIEFRSGESGEHVKRICDITRYMLSETRLGQGMTGEEIEQISLGAIMHDVGKIAVPDQILNKAGKLTTEEYEIMKQHTVVGAKMLSRIPQLKTHPAYQYAYDIARHHHERWDGRGYPDHLEGNEISVPAQIVSIADVYDALVSQRVYKEAFSFDTALKMIAEGECGCFNPDLLDVFFKVEKNFRRFYEEAEKGDL